MDYNPRNRIGRAVRKLKKNHRQSRYIREVWGEPEWKKELRKERMSSRMNQHSKSRF